MEEPLFIETLIEEITRRIGFDARVTVREMGTVFHADIEIREGTGMLIGSGGEGLEALEDIVRKVVRKRLPESPRLVIDVNGYRREQAIALRERAREVAERVHRRGETHVFPPMPSRERRVIHTELASRADVITESQGEGQSRHVVVRPAL